MATKSVCVSLIIGSRLAASCPQPHKLKERVASTPVSYVCLGQTGGAKQRAEDLENIPDATWRGSKAD